MGYRRKQQEKQRNEKLYNATKNKYLKGIYFDEQKGRYIKYSLSDNHKKETTYYKKMCNKAVRKHRGLLNKSLYKKLTEYWYMMY